ncbi:hypothetical protein ACSBR1_015854 [Camellia fascicularis]
MEKTCFLVCVTMLLLVHCLAPCLAMTVTNISTDQSALLALKAHISSDPNKVLLNNWTTGSSVCNWIGVICNTRHKRVAALNIPDMGLIGTIPPHLGNLSFLVRLDIANNSFHGDLPKELANLRRLELFDVRFNNFGGLIPPWLGSLAELQGLYLGNNNFAGTISQEITNLHKMEILEMEHNQLTGSIPISIFNISSLQVIAFTGNGLSGNLPANMCHRHLPKLKFIYLSRNQFDGQIPSGLSECSQLQELSLSFNKFRGPIPAEIGNLTMLKKLYLGRNNFKGSIPQEIGELHSLELLDLSFNSLIGPIPSNIFNISTLQVLGLVDNHLSGYLPSSIGNWLPNVEGLYLALNKLTGIIPDSISNASKLISLDVAMNSFTGVIPDTIGNLKFIQLFNIGGNNLTSKSSMPQDNFLTSLIKCKQLRILLIEENPLNVILPITIGNLSYLESFDASNCKITSSIPEGIGDLSNLVTIKLRDNDLSGEIPTKVGELWKVQYLDLSGNKLQPSIPSNLCNLRNLAFLFLSRNKLSGPLPTCLGNLSFLRSLQVDSNGLTSTIPLTLWNLKDLLVLNLSSNTLSGALSSEIEKLNVVTQIDLSRNQLSGNIPSSIGNLQNLANLSLAHNKFQGSIPKSIGSLISLEFLDLSQNNFSDVIPKSLEQLSYLKYLDLSSNMLEGEIPEGGPFVNFTARSFLWNKALCGMRRFQVQPCTSTHHRSRETMELVLKYILPITASLVLILLSIYALATCQKRKAETSSQENLFPGIKPRRFSYQELLQATSGFTNHNLLGTGSFSSVYKGLLSDGMMVAIKVFDLQLEGSLKSFENECEVMRNVRHRNLIKVIGNCSNLDFKALVIDFMPNGSLEKWLYNPGYCLDILDRMNIMINVALALEYLHHGYSTLVVHCDVKPSNVLLDEDMVAHLGDYGIAKLLGKQDSMAQTKTLATIGYIAPEYGSEGIVSPKGDVYSYGIMLMETFTMKKPTDEMFAGELSLKNWVNESLTCAVSKVIQADILGKDDEHYNVKEHCIKSIMQLAISCCADSPGERLDIKDVLSTLEKIKVEFLTNTQGA